MRIASFCHQNMSCTTYSCIFNTYRYFCWCANAIFIVACNRSGEMKVEGDRLIVRDQQNCQRTSVPGSTLITLPSLLATLIYDVNAPLSSPFSIARTQLYNITDHFMRYLNARKIEKSRRRIRISILTECIHIQ